MTLDRSARPTAAAPARHIRIFVAGASGAIGRPLVAMLVAAGHDVTGTTCSPEGAAAISASGARAAIVDVFDAGALTAAAEASRPDVPIGDEELARNAHVREVGTRNLLDAAAAAGARRLIAQSIAWLYLPGREPHDEDDPIVPVDRSSIDPTRRGVIALERMVTTDPRLDGVVLRYGRLYGPGTHATTPPEPPAVHVEAAARAAALALDRGEPGIYNIVNDGGPVANAKARTILGWVPM